MPNEAEQELIAGVMTSDWLGCGLLGQEKGTEWLTVEQGGQRQVGKHSVGDGARGSWTHFSRRLGGTENGSSNVCMFLPKIITIQFHVSTSSY